jgi:hypothetical protein
MRRVCRKILVLFKKTILSIDSIVYRSSFAPVYFLTPPISVIVRAF